MTPAPDARCALPECNRLLIEVEPPLRATARYCCGAHKTRHQRQKARAAPAGLPAAMAGKPHALPAGRSLWPAYRHGAMTRAMRARGRARAAAEAAARLAGASASQGEASLQGAHDDHPLPTGEGG